MRLFVFEGSNREVMLFGTIKNLFLKEIANDYIVCSFNNNIYDLYRKMRASDFTENILTVLKSIWKNKPDKPIHKIQNTSDISEAFLFFDYDGQNNKAQNYTNNVIEDMLEFFSNETDNGKLYISYPMIESIYYTKTLPDIKYIDYTISLKQICDFKKIAYQASGYKSFDFISFRRDKRTNEIIPDNQRIGQLRQNWSGSQHEKK